VTARGPDAANGAVKHPCTMRTYLVALVLAVAMATGCRAQDPDVRTGLAPPAPAADLYSIGTPSADGPMSHRGAAWLERPDREEEERPYAVVAALQLADDAVVVDLGAGTGYYTRRLARAVPGGRVIAVDIQPEMLEILRRQIAAEGLDHVETVLGTERDPGLSPNTVDLTLIVDSYHEFGYPREVMDAVYDATRPGGRVVVIEYRAEDPTVPIRPLHKMSEAQVRHELEAAGFRFVENATFLPQQHFLIFER
jgi:FkbM family methyltransferase